MSDNVFAGKAELPSDAELSAALGETRILWDQLISELSTTQEWKSYSRKAGWSLRVLRGKRTIVWLIPCQGCFKVAFILGDKAIEAARQSGLSARLQKLINEAPRYAEGTGIRLEIRTARDLAAVRKLAAIKVEH